MDMAGRVVDRVVVGKGVDREGGNVSGEGVSNGSSQQGPAEKPRKLESQNEITPEIIVLSESELNKYEQETKKFQRFY
ncbi:unnamed protein product [Anisakis simplex]|uniref:Uncharacterized protein n=1 Tax=Anisakis simplex TaxID=6269 RepID=A0A0M3KJM8_ANISI|nr:unnamed protein product [Anisakis simplex]